uniref:Uncharacterized protein n=1 Tax=Oryza nivara TaxID=4536 RepID=A0A0E0GUP7_ORYNI
MVDLSSSSRKPRNVVDRPKRPNRSLVLGAPFALTRKETTRRLPKYKKEEKPCTWASRFVSSPHPTSVFVPPALSLLWLTTLRFKAAGELDHDSIALSELEPWMVAGSGKLEAAALDLSQQTTDPWQGGAGRYSGEPATSARVVLRGPMDELKSSMSERAQGCRQ